MTRYGFLIMITFLALLMGLVSILWKTEGKLVVNEVLPSPKVMLINPIEPVLRKYQRQMEKQLIVKRILEEVKNVEYNLRWSAFLTTDDDSFERILYELKKETGESPEIHEKVYLDGTIVKYCSLRGILFVLKKVKTR
ncbi:MAG: hypothetical protein DRP23_04745 [Thermotogae bacterium]|nr:MAG: hypothetical protein DRP23_04745 [Thermotogota bacterium]